MKFGKNEEGGGFRRECKANLWFLDLFDGYGKMITAIKPPQAIIPHRGGKESYYSATAPRYDPTKKYVPEESDTGRKNNRGESNTKSMTTCYRPFSLSGWKS